MNCDLAVVAQQSLEAELLLGLFGAPEQEGRGQAASEAERETDSWQSVLGELEAGQDAPAPSPGAEPATRRKSSPGHPRIVHFIHQILPPAGRSEREGAAFSIDFEQPAGEPRPHEALKPDFDPPAAPETEEGIPDTAPAAFQPIEAAIPSGAGTEQERPREVAARVCAPAPRPQVRREEDIEDNDEGALTLKAAEPHVPAAAAEAPQPAPVPERVESKRPEAPAVIQREARRPLETAQPHAPRRQSQGPVEPRSSADEPKLPSMPEAAENPDRAAPVMAVRLRAMPEPVQPSSKESAPANKPEPAPAEFSRAGEDGEEQPVADAGAADWSDPGSTDSGAHGLQATARRSGSSPARRQSGEAQPDHPRPDKPRDAFSASAGSAEAPQQGSRVFEPDEPRPAEIVPILSHEPIEISKPAPGNTGVGEIKVKLEVPESEPVHVRFVDRGGEVHVLVRSEQPGASTRLAAGLEDLQQKLEAQQTQMEAWTAPNDGFEGAEQAVETVREIAEHSVSEPHTAANAGQGGARGNPDGQQNARRGWPEWLELLAERSDEAALRRFQKGTRSWRQ